MAEYLELRTARNKFKFGSTYYGRIVFNKWMSRSAIFQILDFNKRPRISFVWNPIQSLKKLLKKISEGKNAKLKASLAHLLALAMYCL